MKLVPYTRALAVAGLLVASTASTLSLGATNVGMKNFRQIIASLYKITGVSLSDATVLETTTRLRSRLPTNGQVTELSAPMVLAMAEMTGAFCFQFIENDAALPAAQRRAHKLVVFGEGPQSLTPAIRTSVIGEYANLFWQRDPTADETTALNALFDGVTKDAPNQADELKRSLRGVCAAVAGSLDTLVY